MPKDPRDGRPPLARFLALILVAALSTAGCESGSNQSGDRTPTSKDATKRQKEMQDFMKNEHPKANNPTKPRSGLHP